MLTSKQQLVFNYIRSFYGINGVMPTVRDIAAQFNIDSTCAYHHMNALRRKGIITWSRTGRSIQILKSPEPAIRTA